MKTIKFTIEGDPRTKKNHQVIAGSGRKCPTCGKPQKQWIRQGQSHDEWAKAAEWQIRAQRIGTEWGGTIYPIDIGVNIKVVFYMATRRKVDLLNLLAAVDDLLVECGVIEDDNSGIVVSHVGSRVRYDKARPRVEIEITPSKGDESCD